MSELAEFIDRTKDKFNNVAPISIKYESEKEYAIQILTSNDYLMKVAMNNKQSLLQAITNVANIGLSLNPAEKQAYLIPRNVKIDGKFIGKVFLEPSYMGLCKLATDSGSIEWIQADCVYQQDIFKDCGVGEKPEHSYNAFSKDRGEFVGVYAVAKTNTGDYLTTIMDADEVNSIRDRSESYKSGYGPWKSDYKEMAKKSVVRNAFKMWPRTNERMTEAVHLSNENEGFEPILTSPEITEFTCNQKNYYDQLIEKNDALEMYVLLSTVEEGVRNNLYHSFEKGTKGKYQQVVDSLYRKGFSIFNDCIEAINDGATSNDDLAVKEVSESLSNDALEMMRDKLTPEAMEIINEK